MPAPANSLRPIRILIVDDRWLPRSRMEKLVRASGGEVAGVCTDLEDFRAQWPQLRFDLAIVDLQLGQELSNRDGWMVATDINTSDRPRPIVICSKYNQEELWRTVPRMKNVVTMGKDASVNQFLQTVYPLIHEFYPDAKRTFTFHPGGNSPQAINSSPEDYFFVKNDNLGYSQKIDPTLITMVKAEPGSKIRIFYEDQQIVFSQNLSGLLKIADNPKLARVSDSAIVNFNYVYGKGTNSIHVRTWGKITEVSIGRAYAKDIEIWWRHFRSK